MSLEDLSGHSDADLWQLIRLNNFRAFDEVYHRYWPKLYLSAYKVTKDHEASEDIIQEVFTHLWMKRKDTVITYLSSYLYGMARNQVFKYLRDGKIARKHLDRINHISFVEQTEQVVNFNELQEMYSKTVAGLPERCREIFQLSRDEHLSTKEIATLLQISSKTVEHQISKALKLLRVALRETILLVFLLFYLCS